MTQPDRGEPLTDSKSALLEAAEAAVASPSPLATRETHSGRRAKHLPLLLVVGAACAVVLVAQPSWLRTPPPAPEPPALIEASARMTLVREAARLRSYRDSLGRLPLTLTEAGGTGANDVVYTPSPDGTFTVHIATDARLSLRSTENIAEFLGTSYESLRERRSR